MVSGCGVDANGLAVWFCKPTKLLQFDYKLSRLINYTACYMLGGFKNENYEYIRN